MIIQSLNCPFCETEMILTKEKTSFTIKGQEVIIDFHSYKCDSCQEGFTTTEVDTINFNLIKEQLKN